MRVTQVSQKYKDMSDAELKDYIYQRLGMDPQWARRGLLALYDEQSEAERTDPVNVHESNGRGFSPQDQEFLSSLAQQALSNMSFSQKQLGWLYKLLPKYAGQLVKLVRELERMEPAFVLTLYFAQVTINTPKRELTGITGELELDSRSMPENIVVRSPSGDQMHSFRLHDVTVGPEGPILFEYLGKLDKEEWKLLISVADPDPLPEWVEQMENALGAKNRKRYNSGS
jgi:hypothetical protein